MDIFRKSDKTRILALVVLVSTVFILFRFTERYIGTVSQVIIGWGFLTLFVVLYKLKNSRKPPMRIVLILIAGFITLRYFIWRTTDTLLYTGIYDLLGMSLLYIAEIYTVTIHFLGMFINIWPLHSETPPLPEDTSKFPTVDVFIPTYTEHIEIVRITVTAALQIDYPKEKFKIFILDDGSTIARRNNQNTSSVAWERYYALKSLADELGVNYLTRENNSHAKAGNINHGLANTQGELILTLDCDHVPTRDILKNTAGFFLRDEKLFLAQTPHFFINPTPVEKSVVANVNISGENDMFYRVIHRGLNSWNASYYCGSAAVLRRCHLESIGGISGKTITEDAETSFLLHAKGFNSVYVNRPMVCGLSPETFDDYIIQRTRWAQGMIQLFIKHNPLFEKGLSWGQRLCYFNSCFFWFFGISRLVFYIAPATFIILGMRVYHASITQIIAYALPHVFATFFLMDFLYGKVRRPFFSEIYESVQSLFLIPAVISVVLNPDKPSFKITPKGTRLEKDALNPLAMLFFIVVLVNLAAVPIAVSKWFSYPMYRDVIIITASWCSFNILLALMSLGTFWEMKQVRSHHRIMAKGRVSVLFKRNNETIEGSLLDVSLTGLSVAIKPPFEVGHHEDVIIKATDSYGEVYAFPAMIRRHRKTMNGILCGTEFTYHKENYGRIVRFVYGDGQRWMDLWHENIRSKGSSKILLSFLKRGVKGCYGCLIMLAKLNVGKRWPDMPLGAAMSIKLTFSTLKRYIIGSINGLRGHGARPERT